MGLFKKRSSKKNNASLPVLPPPLPMGPPPPEPQPLDMKVNSTPATRQTNGSFDADRFTYDVDLKTGLFFAVTFDFFRPSNNDPLVTNVPYSKEVFARIPEGKKELYIEKFGDPAALEETEMQKTLKQLLEQVAELTGRLPPQPAPARQEQRKADTAAAVGPLRIKHF